MQRGRLRQYTRQIEIIYSISIDIRHVSCFSITIKLTSTPSEEEEKDFYEEPDLCYPFQNRVHRPGKLCLFVFYCKMSEYRKKVTEKIYIRRHSSVYRARQLNYCLTYLPLEGLATTSIGYCARSDKQHLLNICSLHVRHCRYVISVRQLSFPVECDNLVVILIIPCCQLC